MTRYVRVLLPVHRTDGFDYAIPKEMELSVGDIVQVPFRKTTLPGVVVLLDPPTVETWQYRKVLSVLHQGGIHTAFLKFLHQASSHTMTSIGTMLKMVFPIPEALLEEKQITYLDINANHEGSFTRTEARRRVLAHLEEDAPLTVPELMEKADVSRPVITKMMEIGLLIEANMPTADEAPPIIDADLPALSEQQQVAVDTLADQLKPDEYHCSVLEGVTGSGKTEVYFHLIADILRQPSGQVLILLPEIALTTQLVQRIEERFGTAPVMWHSQMPKSQKRRMWRAIHNGTARIVIGARSALFLPFDALSFIIVDEEHDASYKQEEQSIYHARDMAVLRGYHEKCPVLLASATPSLETVQNMQCGKFSHVKLDSRFGQAVLPDIKLIDTRREPKGQWLSFTLRRALTATLEAKKQALLFLNRRGYAPLTLCNECGYRYMCPQCSSWLVEHRSKKRLECHHCGYVQSLPESCHGCHQPDTLVACGPGVERIEEEVLKNFPRARTMVITRDHIRHPEEAEALLNKIHNQEVDIIIGTQLMAKGHHFPHLTLVGIIDADLGLSGGDIRASEHTYQLLEQVSGRAGRADSKGTVYIQTRMPENNLMQSLINGNRHSFMETELTQRQQQHMPPYGRFIALIVSGKQEEQVRSYAMMLARTAPPHEHIDLLGPVPATIAQLRGKYRYRLLIKGPKTAKLQEWLKSWLYEMKQPTSIHLKVDVDPYNFL